MALFTRWNEEWQDMLNDSEGDTILYRSSDEDESDVEITHDTQNEQSLIEDAEQVDVDDEGDDSDSDYRLSEDQSDTSWSCPDGSDAEDRGRPKHGRKRRRVRSSTRAKQIRESKKGGKVSLEPPEHARARGDKLPTTCRSVVAALPNTAFCEFCRSGGKRWRLTFDGVPHCERKVNAYTARYGGHYRVSDRSKPECSSANSDQ
ncbi:hypothetical protein CYMTET_55167 [Cymbomonas tetramitiformis]|uniref:Uncharacterized protein n=1 Tax=Cymbomonas tetramitiformis TaxID=36881 RepID=A0AAE0BDW2_9CHLO|nr:hypothetical protein CYMTET_55167 [Cymbomonas tetramitiformis]